MSVFTHCFGVCAQRRDGETCRQLRPHLPCQSNGSLRGQQHYWTCLCSLSWWQVLLWRVCWQGRQQQSCGSNQEDINKGQGEEEKNRPCEAARTSAKTKPRRSGVWWWHWIWSFLSLIFCCWTSDLFLKYCRYYKECAGICVTCPSKWTLPQIYIFHYPIFNVRKHKSCFYRPYEAVTCW